MPKLRLLLLLLLLLLPLLVLLAPYPMKPAAVLTSLLYRKYSIHTAEQSRMYNRANL